VTSGHGSSCHGPGLVQYVTVTVTVAPGVCVYYCSTYYKAVRVGGGGNNGRHVLRGTKSRGLCGLVCPSRTSERGGEGDCVKGGGGEERERERKRAREVRLHYCLGFQVDL
jgi:hypothetical protein